MTQRWRGEGDVFSNRLCV